MRVQHNVKAMNAYRNYTSNVSAMKKDLEKLSSGYKINRAGDDAAGLAISEKMRAQITGLETAQKNAKDGISLVQTAEGALQEVHDMLNRMVELATQSANGTYDNTTDRYQLQKEVDQLRAEIDRISDSANFNGIKLLDGSLDGADKVIAKMDEAETVLVTPTLDGSPFRAGFGYYAVYEVDLNDFQFNNGVSGETVSITIIVGGVTFAASAVFGSDGKLTAADFSNMEMTNVLTDGHKTWVNGMTYDITIEQGKKIKFMSREFLKSVDYLFDDMKVEVYTSHEAEYNQGIDGAAHMTSGELPYVPKMAHGTFELTGNMITDGAKLAIGSRTYVFRVGKNSKARIDGPNQDYIDLRNYEPDDENLLWRAVMELTRVNGTTRGVDFHATVEKVRPGQSSYTVHLTEVMYKVNYSTDWNLQGTSARADGNWNSGVAGGKYEGRGVVTFQADETTIKGDANKSLTLQIGDTAESFNQLKVNVGSANCSALGIDAIDISTQFGAAEAVDTIKAAIDQVSDIRGTLGATQNRLEHTINNLSVMTENMQDAESTIRDTDIAEVMMAYTKNNILIQSAQAMLAQANQVPQGVLQLLQ